jgi:hypothetical protein
MNEYFGIWREMAITAAPIEAALPGSKLRSNQPLCYSENLYSQADRRSKMNENSPYQEAIPAVAFILCLMRLNF